MGVSLLEHRTNEEILEEAKVSTDSDGLEKEKAGMVRARYKARDETEHESSCGNEDGGGAL